MKYSIPTDILAKARKSVFPHHVAGELVYVKKRRPRKNPMGRLAQRLLHRLSNNPLLLPPHPPIGDNVAFETETLARLAAHGVNVPRVLHRDSDYFVMSDAGETLEMALHREPERKDEYIALAAKALRRFHEQGFAHGGAQIRNFTVKDGEVYFIDFEEMIPPQFLAEFQIRDVFLLILSLERNHHDPDIETVCALYDGGAGGTAARLADALVKLRMARFLDSRLFERIKMRDIRSLTTLIRKAQRVARGRKVNPNAGNQ